MQASPKAAHLSRFFWLKCTSVAWVVALLTTFALGWFWTRHMSRLLHTEADRLKMSGEPIYLEDYLQYVDVPDDDNAALLVTNAIRLWNTEHLDDNARYLADNAEPLRLMRLARNKPRSRWPVQFSVPIDIGDFKDMKAARAFVHRLSDVAQRHVQNHDARQAIEAVFDQFTLARVGGDNPTGLISVMSKLAVRSEAYHTLEALLPRMDDRTRLGQLADYLTDEGFYNADLLEATRFERMAVWENFSELSHKEKPFQGFICRDTIDIIRYLNAIAEDLNAAREPAPIAYITSAVPPWVDSSTLGEPYHLFGEIIFPSFSIPLKMVPEAANHQRMARLAIVIRIYELDNGRRPATLNDLLPRYLDALPVDLTNPDRDTFGYDGDQLRSAASLYPRPFCVFSLTGDPLIPFNPSSQE